jgi:hypothetical protein
LLEIPIFSPGNKAALCSIGSSRISMYYLILIHNAFNAMQTPQTSYWESSPNIYLLIVLHNAMNTFWWVPFVVHSHSTHESVLCWRTRKMTHPTTSLAAIAPGSNSSVLTAPILALFSVKRIRHSLVCVSEWCSHT